nr:MAG TPA: hypothetical protein [Caudoviricetes sp.]
MELCRTAHMAGGVNVERWRVSYFDKDGFCKAFIVDGTFDDLYDYLSTRSEVTITYSVFSSKGKLFYIAI